MVLVIAVEYAPQPSADLRYRVVHLLTEFLPERRQDPAEPVRAFRPAEQPEAFTFLGFKHVCAENSLGRFEVRRITDVGRRRKKLQAIKQEIRRKMHDPVAQVGGWLRSVLNGYYQYHAVPGNLTVLGRFRRQVARYWFHALGQRSQRRPTWEKLGKVFDQWLPVPRVVHDFPDARFRASRRAAAYPK